jgi:hypothetical protein
MPLVFDFRTYKQLKMDQSMHLKQYVGAANMDEGSIEHEHAAC